MLRKISVLLFFMILVIALAVGCSSKGSGKDSETTVQVEEVASVEVTATVETPAEEPPAEETQVEEQKAEEPQETGSVEEASEEDIEFVMPSTLAEKFSYAFGAYVASYYGDYATYYYPMYQAQVYPELDFYYGSMGIYDFMNGSLRYTIEELNQMINDYLVDYDIRMAALADENLAKAESFLAENAKKPGVYTTESGLQYEIVRKGDGAFAQATDSVELDYELTLMDGTVIDSSYARGAHSTFPLSGVISGFSEGVMLMPMGSEYIFYIHPSLGYGDQATGSMDPNSLLIFRVETYSIQGE